MNDVELKAVDSKDVDSLQNDARQIWQQCYAEILNPEQIEYMLDWMYSPETIRREIDHENIIYSIIMHGNTRIGFCSWGPYGKVAGQAKLHKLYLFPDFQGKGLGSASLRQICDAISRQGYTSVRLNVNKSNTAAIKAYERNGFKKADSIVADIGNGYVMDDYIMIKDLS